MTTKHRRPRTVTSGMAAIVLALAACSGGGGVGTSTSASTSAVAQSAIDKAMTTPTTLTYWTWAPGAQKSIDLFHKAYPAITVKLEDVAQGAAEYTKLHSAIQSGKGIPDDVAIAYENLPEFEVTGSLLNLAPYGDVKVSEAFPAWVWDSVSIGDNVYGMPHDTGPMGNVYRQDILTAAGVTVAPSTWAEYATDAALVKAKTGAYMTNLPPSDGDPIISLLWQAGAQPFGYDGKQHVTIHVNSAVAKKVMSYWQSLIQANEVAVDPDFTNQWYQGFATGHYAGWLTAAWGPYLLTTSAANTAGKWRVAGLPQWQAGASSSSNWGGTAVSVPKATTNPIAAAKLATWLNTDNAANLSKATAFGLFPAAKATLADPQFVNQTSTFFGGQAINKLFAQFSTHVDTKFEWLPFMDYAFSSYTNTLGKAMANKGDLSAGLDSWQDQLVTYAKKQGFTVN